MRAVNHSYCFGDTGSKLTCLATEGRWGSGLPPVLAPGPAGDLPRSPPGVPAEPTEPPVGRPERPPDPPVEPTEPTEGKMFRLAAVLEAVAE
jgi:hypothetical protein